MKTRPEIYEGIDSYTYAFKSKGLAISIDGSGLVKMIQFFSEGAEGFTEFQGVLPYTLTFLQTRAEIESILGSPEESGSGIYNSWGDYASKGIGITYNTPDPNDVDARIYSVWINRNIRWP
ncbi:MAG: hypothetical protein A2Y69_07145 [Candidatus Aminicenantes bacterium RBG_13_59_9]|nr:MAG: hypothetical protein A2Y69_07145 [Candidatus Aminicenantes bacterium RBG_13_59_9]